MRRMTHPQIRRVAEWVAVILLAAVGLGLAAWAAVTTGGGIGCHHDMS